MHSSSHFLIPRSHYSHISWEAPPPPRSRSIPRIALPSPPNQLVPSDFPDSTSHVNVEGNDTVSFPVIIRKSGRASRYVWDGCGLQLVRVDGHFDFPGWFESENGILCLLRSCCSAVRGFFVPQQVQENYIGYLKWKFLHRVFSSALQVLATQAMFRAIGIGSARSLPSAAAMNWVLKDGIGRLSRCIYTASLGSAFDTNLKRVRFSTSVLFSLSIGIELLTPAFPEHFLLLATMANVAKSISLAAYLATGSAIHRSFALADNLGEVSAKSQLQTVCFDNLGLILAALLNISCRNHKGFQAGLPLVIYPFFAAVDLLAIYNGLKHVHLYTLTKDRLEIIIDTWIRSAYVPSPAEVSNKEDINFLALKGNMPFPIRMGCINSRDLLPTISKVTLQCLNKEDHYFICLEMFLRGLTKRKQLGVLLSLKEGAGAVDVITGLLQACRIRKSLILDKGRWDSISEVGNTDSSMCPDWFHVVNESRSQLQRDIKSLVESMQKCGWVTKSILLSSQEQIRYSLIDEG